MNNESYKIRENEAKLLPSILDASVFTSLSHCEVLLEARKKFFISEALYTILYKEYDREKVFNTLSRFVWQPLKYLPLEKINLQPYLIPYKFKKEYTEEIYPHYQESRLPVEVKQIILDEYSFLKEHSSIFMSTKRFSKYLHQWGVIFMDATNKFYDGKHSFFKKMRGVRWIMGFLLQAAGIARFAEDPRIGTILQASGAVLILLDP
jgi:hypothetical protein